MVLKVNITIGENTKPYFATVIGRDFEKKLAYIQPCVHLLTLKCERVYTGKSLV